MEAKAPPIASPKLQLNSKRDKVETTIIDACEELLEQKPFAQISIEDLANQAGIQRTAFYFYFANKQEVLAKLIEKVADALYEKAQTWLVQVEGDQDDLEQAMDEIVGVFSEHATTFRAAVEVSTYVDQMGEFWRMLVGRFIDATEAKIRSDQRQGGPVRKSIDPHLTAEALVWMTERYCYQIIAVDSERDPRDVVKTLASIYRYVLLEKPNYEEEG